MNTHPNNQLIGFSAEPDKRLGQNFLVDTGSIDALMNFLPDELPDRIVEVGPGLGAITRPLAHKVKEVQAIEKDQNLITELRKALQQEGITNVHIKEEDARRTRYGTDGLPYAFVSNLPFNAGAHILQQVISAQNPPTVSVVVLQKEVAERICVKGGAWSLLALAIHLYAQPELGDIIPARAFEPQPKIDAALLRLTPHKTAPIAIPQDEITDFFRLLRAGFSSKRKKLRNALANGLSIPTTETEKLLKQADIDPDLRAERLTLKEWERLYRAWQHTA